MLAAPPDIARLQPTRDTLNVILKNTHFRDDTLSENSKIRLRIDYSTSLPILVFRFDQPYYDFLQILTPAVLVGPNIEWINRNPVVIKLVLSETVMTDRLSERRFYLGPTEAEQLRVCLTSMKNSSPTELRKTEEFIYLNYGRLLG